MKEQTLTEQYIEYMTDYYPEEFNKLIEERLSEEIFNYGQDQYDKAMDMIAGNAAIELSKILYKESK